MNTRAFSVVLAAVACATAAPAAVSEAAQPGGHALARETAFTQGPVPGAPLCDETALGARRSLSLPLDDAPHREDRNYWEWWFWTGHLEATPVGKTRVKKPPKRYTFMLAWEWKPALHIQQAVYVIGDVARGSTHYRRHGDIVGDPPVGSGRFSFRGPGASAAGGGGRDVLSVKADGLKLDVTARAQKAPVFHFGDGHVSLYCQEAFYYQRPRMKVTGRLVDRGVKMRVRGTATYDHQWGLTAAYQVAQSEYLILELDDGTDIFLGDVRFPPTSYARGAAAPRRLQAFIRFGSISAPDGSVTILGKDDFSLTPIRYQRRSPLCAYPVAWDVRLAGRRYRMDPLIEDSEFRSVRAPLNYALWQEDAVIWDGGMAVSGDAGGRGWLDLVRSCPDR